MRLHSRHISLILAFIAAVTSVASTRAQDGSAKTTVLLASDVDWQQLNPARGDKSPQAATLWGDRNGTVATGFLVKFVDGFSSPPHIHNVTYRGVVIRGLVHNDDPQAKPMWMPKGSFWTQPAGEPHITSAMGSTIAFIEIDKGPYLVKPIDEAFDKGERPVNIDASNLVWLDASDTNWIKTSRTTKGPEISFLWGKPRTGKPSGTLVRLPPRFSGTIRALGSDFKAVVIEGQTDLKRGSNSDSTLAPGSYFHARGKATHDLSCDSKTGCLIYVRSVGKFSVSAN